MDLLFRVHVIGDIPDDQKLSIQKQVFEQIIRSANRDALSRFQAIVRTDSKLKDVEIDNSVNLPIRERDDTLDDGVVGYVDNLIAFVHRKR